MRGHHGAMLLTFGLIVGLGHTWHVLDLDTLPPAWLQIIGLLGASGLSVVSISLLLRVWAVARSRRRRASSADMSRAALADAAGSEASISDEERSSERIVRHSQLLDARWYFSTYPDVATAGVDAVEHYVRSGAAEGRNPNPVFDTAWYLDQNPDVRQAGINPLVHFILDGASEGRAAGPDFDTAFYLAQNGDIATSGVNPLAHYLMDGRHEGREAVHSG